VFTLPDLPYGYDGLEPFIDERTMQIHHDKHHGAYVKNLNDALTDVAEYKDKEVEEILKRLDKLPETVRTKVRNNGGGHYNHSLFWQMMAPEGRGEEAKGEFLEWVNSKGGLEEFKKHFEAEALMVFGSGWAWLAYYPDTKEVAYLHTPNQDNPLMLGAVPILGLDVWEHAYYLKYQNMRGDYVKAWWNVLNWGEVSRRFAMAVAK